MSRPPAATGTTSPATVSPTGLPVTIDEPVSSPPETLDAVLFDLDGTLNDSQRGIINSLREAFVANGLDDPGYEALLPAIGPPFEVGLTPFGVTAELLDAVIDVYRQRYEEVGLFECALYPGVVELLDAVATLDVRIAVATAKPEPTAVRVLDHFGLSDRFVTIAGSTHARNGPGSRRTKGEVITEALARLSVDPDHASGTVVMVGDRDHDVEGAAEHGIGTIGVAWGYGSHDELLGAGATVVCATPGEVAVHLTTTYGSRTR